MPLYDRILLCSDFDRTLTDHNAQVPQRNIDAIRHFMENGGAFTINTGRSLPMAQHFIGKVPVNAPLLLYNGAAAYDLEEKCFTFRHSFTQPQTELIAQLLAHSSGYVLEAQGIDRHYSFGYDAGWEGLYEFVHCPHCSCAPEDELDAFIKLSILGPINSNRISDFFKPSPVESARYDALHEKLNGIFGDSLSIVRAATTILDIQPGGVNKGRAAQELKAQLGRDILICVGDQMNDITMLDAADYAFCPGDAAIRQRYENVCACGDGALADVIYEKIPKILK